MANKALFGGSTRGRSVPAATTRNAAGGLAYEMTPEHALAQMACTGTFNDAFYTTGAQQLDAIKQVADQVDPEFLAKCAVYAREKGYMKDMPAALAVMLTKASPELLNKVFLRVIDNGKQLRNFVQLIRSGAFGRKSLGSGPKRQIQRWFDKKSDYAIFKASIGNDPTLADILKLARVKPRSDARQAFYGYLLGLDPVSEGKPREETWTDNGKTKVRRRYERHLLPEFVLQYEAWKRGERQGDVPNVDFRMLTGLPLTTEDWKQIALRGGWHMVRMNLNTFQRHGVLDDEDVVDQLARKLTDAEAIRKAKVFPYQLLAAYLATGAHQYTGRWAAYSRVAAPANPIPTKLQIALQDAVETAVENVPKFEGRVAVIVDVSGSMMSAPVTGHRKGATTAVKAIDVAALVGATVLRKNPLGVVIPVDTSVHRTDAINPKDSIMTNANKLRNFGGGGTDLSAALRFLAGKAAPDLIIMVSDNESWVDSRGRYAYRGTSSMSEFKKLQARNKNLKMVCIDTCANNTTQVSDTDPSILNIGGFNDQIWTTIQKFVSNEGPAEWVAEIKAIDLDKIQDTRA